MKNNPIRGFKALVGATIKKIDATGVNCILIETTDGKTYYIDASEWAGIVGIPLIKCYEEGT